MLGEESRTPPRASGPQSGPRTPGRSRSRPMGALSPSSHSCLNHTDAWVSGLVDRVSHPKEGGGRDGPGRAVDGRHARPPGSRPLCHGVGRNPGCPFAQTRQRGANGIVGSIDFLYVAFSTPANEAYHAAAAVAIPIYPPHSVTFMFD